MSQLRQGLLPLDALDDQQFESLLLQFLGAGISLEVLEAVPARRDTNEVSSVAADPLPTDSGAITTTTRSIRRRVIHVSKYGPSGRAGQRGIDLRAMTEDGLEWVFQCKHYTSGFTAAQARAAVEKAESDYPTASRYFLVISGEPVPEVHDVVDVRPRWELWGRSALSVKFFNETPRPKQIDILRRLFPAESDAIIKRLFPVHDDLLIDATDFFEQWIKEGRLFHHRAALVGREAPLLALHDFVADPDLRVLILPAPGGVGKTRLLRAFGETFSEKHPGRQLLFVDPHAQAGAGWDRLRAAAPGTPVVVQDDAHRSEVLRAALVASVLDREGKLVFATRPHGIDALIGWLTHAGVEHARIHTLPSLPALSREDRVTLARECLPAGKKDFAEALAERAQGCTLIITVGAQLIVEKDLHPAEHLDSRDFKVEVFDRLEGDSIAPLTTRDGEPALRDTLRLLAVLASWSERILSVDTAAALIGITPRVFQDNLEKLHCAGWLVETREGWRVVPDLLADHLVYRGCYQLDGGLTRFARELQKTLRGQAGGMVFRNLAEAEWQAQLNGRTAESLLAPFWNELLEKFAAEDFWERSQRIVEWRRFAVYQPERSLRLARLAIDLDTEPPPPKEMRAWRTASSLYSHEQVLGNLPALLEPIATYHAAHRWAALDLLWALHLKRARIEKNAQNEPLAVMGRVAKFVHGHPADAPVKVVRWLADRLRGPHAADLCDRPSSALSLMLKPIFERELEANFSSGMTFTFRAIPLSAESTRTLRDEALVLLREQVMPRGEIAVLNALPVLDTAIDMVRRPWGGEVTEEMEAEWMPERLAALRMIEALIAPDQSPQVLLSVRRHVQPHAYGEPHAPFKVECERVLAMIPDTHELRRARVLLSNAWDEFEHETPHEESATDSHSKREALWSQLGDRVALEFLAAHPTPEAIILAAEESYADYQRCGLSPQFSDLFSAIGRLRPELSVDCIDVLLARESSPVDYWWTSFLLARCQLTDSRLQGWLTTVLRGKNTVRWRAAQWTLRLASEGDVPVDIIGEIAAWASRLDNDTLVEAMEQLRWRGNKDRRIDDVILQNLNLARLSEAVINKLAACLRIGRGVEDEALPVSFVRCFIDELHRFDRLNAHDSESLWKYLAKAEPRYFYDMLKRRVLETEERRAAGQAFDPLPIRGIGLPLSRLPEDTDYASLADELYQCWRSAGPDARFWWTRLFQDAVLRVSPLGLDYLNRGLAEATSGDDLEALIGALKFNGSMFIFEQPSFVKELLGKIRILAPARFDELGYSLRASAAPTMRAYKNHELDSAYRYYREAAVKAVEVQAHDPELVGFYREIIRTEDADAARQRRWAALEMAEWD